MSGLEKATVLESILIHGGFLILLITEHTGYVGMWGIQDSAHHFAEKLFGQLENMERNVTLCRRVKQVTCRMQLGLVVGPESFLRYIISTCEVAARLTSFFHRDGLKGTVTLRLKAS